MEKAKFVLTMMGLISVIGSALAYKSHAGKPGWLDQWRRNRAVYSADYYLQCAASSLRDAGEV
jgi:hypothetical protein